MAKIFLQISVDIYYKPKVDDKNKNKDKNVIKVHKWPAWVREADSGTPIKFRTFNPITIYNRKVSRERGKIRVLKIYNRFSKVDDALKKWPIVLDENGQAYEKYNVCKNNQYQDLSPMKLGPVIVKGQVYAHNIEDAWQCSKVYEYQQRMNKGDGDWLKNWNEWSKRGRMSGEARRHRSSKSKTLYSIYQGEKLYYKEARNKMYLTWYEELVVKTDAYKDLLNRHLSGVNLLLLEYDGLDRDSKEYNIDLTEEKLKQLINDDSRPFGHGLALASLLLGYPVWRKYEKRQIIEQK